MAGSTVFELDLAEDLPPIEAEEAQIGQVVMNLVTNAAESQSDGHGRVVVRTGVAQVDEPPAGALFAETMEKGKHVFLEVTDAGSGMDAETRARIFDPFYTTKFTGRGLGLAAVSGIVRAHHGAIQVDSEPGRGTRFRVSFPAVEAQAADVDVRGEALGEAVRVEKVRKRRDARALGPDVRARCGGRETLDGRKTTAHVEGVEGCAPSAPRVLHREEARGDDGEHEERRARDGRAGGGGAQLVRRLRPRKSSGRITLDAVSLPRRRSRPATCQRRSDAPDEAQGHRRARRRGGDVQGRTLELAHHAAREAPSDVRRSRCVVSVVSS